PLTSEDIELTAGNTFGEEPAVESYTSERYEGKVLQTLILPFVARGGKLLKLASFELSVEKNKGIQRAASAPANSYAESSALKQGKFFKIRVSENGIYKLTNKDLSDMGVSPQNVRIFGYGGAELPRDITKPKIDDLPEVAVWEGSDYILFYAQGVNKWSYDASGSQKKFTHTLNSYSQYGYYFVTSGAGTGKRIQQGTAPNPGASTVHEVSEFTDYQVHEKEERVIIKSGRDFFGEIFDAALSCDFSFNFPNLVQEANSVNVRLSVAATSLVASSFSLKLNDSSQERTLPVPQTSSGDNYDKGRQAETNFSFSPVAEGKLDFTLKYNRIIFSAKGYLNFMEVNARRKLMMSGDAMPFRNVDNTGTGTFNRYTLSNASENIEIWDVTDRQNIQRVPAGREGQTLTFLSSNDSQKEYVALNPAASYSRPYIVGEIANQNLHGLPQVDLLIITHPDFRDEANELAKAHREYNNMLVEVVTTEQVYNEFSSGTPDASAYRWIMKMFYDRAAVEGNYPQNLLLFGKGSYDNRNLFANETNGTNLILTVQGDNLTHRIQSFITDDYFAYMEDKDASISTMQMAFGVGRFPIITKQQAKDVVAKNIAYIKNEDKGAWKNQLCFVADDGDKTLHVGQANQLATYLSNNYKSYQIHKVYMDAYVQQKTASGERYPLAKDRLHNLIRSGLFYLNYTGHAGAHGWTGEQILTKVDISGLSNKYLPLCFAATCDFILFDNSIISSGEEMLLNPVGGAIGVISAARVVYASNNFNLNNEFNNHLLRKENQEHLTVGDMLRRAKNGVIDSNKLSYVLIGNPALKLTYPTRYNIRTTQINDNTSLGNDSLGALSINTIKGAVFDEKGDSIVTDFNGTVSLALYDKEQQITTLNNDGEFDAVTGKPYTYTYADRPNMLFSGKAEVKEGEFSISVMIPKDIKYNYGSGRINYYAQDADNENKNNYEAQGYFENFTIGGEQKGVVIEDKAGPVIEQIYLNHPGFVSRDKVNETPYFAATVSDENGINTTGSGIGHDMTLTIDNDPNQSHILNSYYEAELDSYKRGSVHYKIPEELSEGKHVLTYRVWDLLNNSTTVSLDFEVVKGLNPEIYSVLSYPNPASTTDIVYFKVVHDRPETVLQFTVDVFDSSGRRIWTDTQRRTESIDWDLTATNGEKFSTGLYFYRIGITTTEGKLVSKTNKLIITN
ncbi:MAG: type IX secretion system sortase PorU, partial [Prevotellaceae bacterium]|nr:type IX secretion system sortase PorU [Prevotellaceae bacterium]